MSNPKPTQSADSSKGADVPAALRDRRQARVATPVSTSAPKRRTIVPIAIGIGGLLAGGAAFVFAMTSRNPSSTNTPTAVESNSRTASPSSPENENVFNHLSYAEAPPAELASIGGGYRLRSTAAKKFLAMVADARSQGVKIATISAFRSVSEQKQLFFGVGAERDQQPSKRAEVSAPPKYSEHHTGYAVDVGDGTVAATNLNQDFDTTPAYKWLKTNAAKYSFELSFPKDNIQKVSYEPWHWRFVGDINSLETFYRAHQLQPR